MIRKTELDYREAARALFPDGCHVLLAVSGGGDSVALLHLTERYARRGRLTLAVAHLDHGLRRGSRADRRFVERLAAELGIPCHAERREVRRRRGESPEEAARRVRRRFLLDQAAACGVHRIATGHTLDDQAETVLMRLVRGAGATALTGMAPEGPGPFVKPLLRLERDALRDWLLACGHDYRDDPSNLDMGFDRNRVRELVMPALREALNPRAARHLVKAAQRFREDAELVDEMARGAFAAWSRIEPPETVALEAEALAGAPAPLANRVAGLALRRAGIDPRRVASRHIEALINLARGGSGRELHLPGRLVARKARRWLRIRRGS
jgi:tRNA(Ile)-lysidine synthase